MMMGEKNDLPCNHRKADPGREEGLQEGLGMAEET
jgi:hypothetical protein